MTGAPHTAVVALGSMCLMLYWSCCLASSTPVATGTPLPSHRWLRGTSNILFVGPLGMPEKHEQESSSLCGRVARRSAGGRMVLIGTRVPPPLPPAGTSVCSIALIRAPMFILSVTLLLGPKLGPYSGPENGSTLWPRIRAHFLGPFLGPMVIQLPCVSHCGRWWSPKWAQKMGPNSGPQCGPIFGATIWPQFGAQK